MWSAPLARAERGCGLLGLSGTSAVMAAPPYAVRRPGSNHGPARGCVVGRSGVAGRSRAVRA
ncbi:hypothetical protein NSI01_36950 [Pimelobacter simplex]|nr:hypothetical protein NSI01_36950 [Pimelobacter simplex]